MSEFKDFFQQLWHKTGKIEIVHEFYLRDNDDDNDNNYSVTSRNNIGPKCV